MTLAGKTVLITGAAGFVGGALALRLAQEGARVKALVRHPEKADFLRGQPQIEIVPGDITDAARMVEVTRGCEIVFHVAAVGGGSTEKQRPINVDGTRKVMLAAVAAQVQRVVHVSSIAVYGYSYRNDVTEDLPQKPGPTPYNLTKSEGENVVREIGRQYNLPYAVIRPGMIYGPRSATWTAMLFRVARLKPTPFLGDGSGSVHPIFIEDVVDMLIVLASHPAAVNEVFNCAPDPAPTWREFLSGYARLAGNEKWLSLPVLPVKVLASLIEVILMLRDEPQELPTLIPYMLSHTTYKMTKARDVLGWQPKVDLTEGIERCRSWLQQQGLLK